jgi:hypothetical protein
MKEKTYITRAEKELKKLDEKIFRLDDFINSTLVDELPPIQQDLLLSQLTAMATYSNILGTRLSLIKGE